MVVSFLSTTTIFTINNEYEIGVCAMCSRHIPVNRYFAKSLEPESRGRCLAQVVMDAFFDVANEHDQAGKRHYYIAVRWNHRFQGKWLSCAIFLGLAITRANTVPKAGCYQLTAHAVHREIL